jgi:PAS domain S-box-containing protein
MSTTGGRSQRSHDEEMRVLHVDDDPDIADLTSAYLQKVADDITVVSESSATDGLDRLDAEHIDCVVSDYEMPGKDGIEFLKAVRERHGDLPFVLFTGRGSEEVASEAISAGVTEYLQKEGAAEQFELLANRVANVVSRRRAERRAADLARVNEVIRDVDAALVRESTREAIEDAVCRTLSSANPYTFAWIGTVDGDRATVRTAQPQNDYLDDTALVVDGSGGPESGPLSRAVDTDEVAVCQDVTAAETSAAWPTVALEHGYESVAVVPLRHGVDDYGYMAIYADRPGAFDETERDLLADLGDNIAHAIHAAETSGALRESRTRVSALFENATDSVVYVEYADGEPRIRDVNPAFEETFGHDREAVVGRNVDDVVAPAAHRAEAEAISERVRSGERVEAEVTRETTEGPRQFLLRLVPLDTERADIGRSFAVYTDITEHKRRESDLESLNERVSRLHHVTQHLQAASTRETVFEGTITAAVDILDFDWCVLSTPVDGRFELVAVSEDTPFDVGDAPLAVDEGVGGRAFATGETDLTDDVLADSDGEPADDAIRAALTIPVGEFGLFQACSSEVGGFTDNDRELAEVLVAHITEALTRVEREGELERQNERLDRFAGVVSHDLRNPLNVAQGRVELAQTTGDISHLDPAASALERMNAIIEDVLMLTRGDTPVDLETVSLHDVATTAWSMVDTRDAAFEADVNAHIRADPNRVQRLFENLIRNSVEHGRAETVGLETLTEAVGTGGEGRRDGVGNEDGDGSEDGDGNGNEDVEGGGEPTGFAVVDDGQGFEETDAVFDSGHSTATSGTGLGLAIVKRIAEAHGWTVEAVNGENGARVELRGVTFEDA